jgi:hypothetical protein
VTEPLPSYAIVSPVRDEEARLGRAAEAILAQTHRPQRWVIVDDGSRDGTVPLARRLAEGHDWIELVCTARSGPRARGAPIMRAFALGRERLEPSPDVTVKLDGDVVVPPFYFETVARTFQTRERAAVVGGVVEIPTRRGWRRDRVARHIVHGAAKSYRTRFLDELGGLPESLGWDGIDETAARARGWEVCVLDELRVRHLRPRGAAQPWHEARREEGRGAWALGSRADFVALRVLYRMVYERPPLVGGLAFAAGYLGAAARRAPRIDDPLAVAVMRREQGRRMRRLLSRDVES